MFGLTASLDASGSTDPDGTVTNYAWAFGDGTTSSGTAPTIDHTYPAAATYQVSLTVTDNNGATRTITQPVTAGTTQVLAADQFSRTTTTGWGTADTGGAWTFSGTAATPSVTGGAGVMRLATKGGTTTAALAAVSATELDATVDVTLDKAFAGGSIQFSLVGRRVGANDYRAKLVWLSANRINLQLIRNVAGTSTTLRSVVINGLTFQGNDTLRLHFTLTGTAPPRSTPTSGKSADPNPPPGKPPSPTPHPNSPHPDPSPSRPTCPGARRTRPPHRLRQLGRDGAGALRRSEAQGELASFAAALSHRRGLSRP